MIELKDISMMAEVGGEWSSAPRSWVVVRSGASESMAEKIEFGTLAYYEVAALIVCEGLAQKAHAIADENQPGVVILYVYAAQKQDVPGIEKQFVNPADPLKRSNFDQFRYPGVFVECRVVALEGVADGGAKGEAAQ